MMIVMKEGATEEQIAHVVERIEEVGCSAHLSKGELLTVIGAIGDRDRVAALGLEGSAGVDHLVPILKPYKLASAQFKKGERTVVEVDGRRIGGEHFGLIAGPCTVESREQTLDVARVVNEHGAAMLRGGAYKPRTSPYSFQGLGVEGLRLLQEAKEETGLPIVTELMDVRDVADVVEVADVIQIGARNMQNYTLLTEVGRSRQGGAAQARALLDPRRAADGVGVRAQGGQPERDPVRARDPHLRDRLPVHARPAGDPGAARAHPPAGRRRPEPRAGAPRLGAGRCRWRPPPRAPTGSSSRSTTTPSTRSATARRRCRRRASPSTRSRSGASPRWPARKSSTV